MNGFPKPESAASERPAAPLLRKEALMRGTMLWFNLDKGYGYIHSEGGERLHVARDGFRAGHEPEPRCKGREVSFYRRVDDGTARAVDVAFVAAAAAPRRARLRHTRGASSL
jgi:cold shock CspA family protein